MTQLTLDGAARKAQGLDTIEERDAGFIRAMRQKAMTISRDLGQVTTDDLRLWAASLGLYPRHPNVYGAIFRGPQWQVIGYKPSVLPSNHHRRIAIWKWRGA